MLDRHHRPRYRFAGARPTAPAALEELRFIRQTLERSSSFTAVSGWGLVALGVTALPAAWLAQRQTSQAIWLASWLGEALVAVTIGVATTYKKPQRAGLPMTSGPGRRFVLSFLPPAVAAALLTPVMFHLGMMQLLPALWLLLCGASVISAGAFSVPALPVMGVCFMLAGVVALCLPGGWGNGMVAAGFGGLHLVFGTVIARRYGG